LFFLVPIAISVGSSAKKENNVVPEILGYNALNLSLIIFIFLSFILVVLCLFSKDAKEKVLLKQNTLTATASFLLGLSILIKSLSFSSQVFFKQETNNQLDVMSVSLFVLGVLVSFYFLVWSLMAFNKKDMFKKFSCLTVLPVISSLFCAQQFRMIKFDLAYENFVPFLILTFCLLAIFFLYQAKIISEAELEKNTKVKSGFTICGFLSVAALVFFFIISFLYKLNSDVGFLEIFLDSFLNLSVIFYVIVFLIILSFSSKEDSSIY
jgi:hypothetical protein